jgi:hypothetical protein
MFIFSCWCRDYKKPWEDANEVGANTVGANTNEVGANEVDAIIDTIYDLSGVTINPLYNLFDDELFENADEVGANANEVDANANEMGANEVDANANEVDANANEVDANEMGANANEIGPDIDKKKRPKLNRKPKAELNEEFYNNSKIALKDLDKYLEDNSFGFF